MTRDRLLSFCLALGLGLGVASPTTAAGNPKPGTSFYGDLNDADISLAWSSLQETLDTRLTEENGDWRNVATGTSGSVVPLRTYRIRSGTYCRDYREVVMHGARAVARIGTACRDKDGTWVPVER